MGKNQDMKQLQPHPHLAGKDLPLRRNARLRERAESLILLAGIMAFWVFVFTLNFLVGQASTPLIR